ncbi:unnamed protein product [Phytomonas sp. Hart1]|nr:unnamed protein product [Phytomonas sp. Hart1]|eukprot:CCW71102.1 unnamed protein product [Phytomonas sp. isolate Hart1]
MVFLNLYNVQVARSPYEVVGAQAFQPSGTLVSSPMNAKRFPVGALGVRELASRQSHSPLSPHFSSTGFSAFLCRQRKGQLLVCSWEDLRQIGSCSHGAHTSVVQCLITATFLITRIECNLGEDALQSDHNIYVWDAKTFARLYELHGHTARVTNVTVHPFHPNILVTAALDYMMCVWELSMNTATCLWDEETRNLGTITHLEWLPYRRPEKLTGLGTSLLVAATDVPLSVWRWDGAILTQMAATPVNCNSAVTAVHVRASSNGTQCVVHTGSTDGCVRMWVIDSNPADETCTIEMKYQVKLHHASISHLLGNDRINVSGSLYSGVALYHCQKGTKATFEEIGGVSSMALDDTNKLILVGAMNGVLWIIGYTGFENAEENVKSRELTTLYRFYMSKTAITGIVLEFMNDNTWKRLLVVSLNGSITVLDYSLRHVRTISSSKASAKDSPPEFSRSIAAVPFLLKTGDEGRTLLIAQIKKNSIAIIDNDKPNYTDYGTITLPKKNLVTCLHWDTAIEKMFIGVQRDTVRAFCLDSANPKSGVWIEINLWKISAYLPISFSSTARNIIAVCLTDNPIALAKAQGWLGILVSTNSESDKDGLVVLKSLQDAVPFSVKLLESTANQANIQSLDWTATAVVQNTRGIIQMFSVEVTDRQTDYQVTPKLILTPPAHMIHKMGKFENMKNPFLCKPSYIVHYESPSRKDVLIVKWVENSILFTTRVYTSMDYKSIILDPSKLPNIPKNSSPVFVREVHQVNSHGVSVVVLYDNSLYALLLGTMNEGEKAVPMFTLSYTGEVLQYNDEKWKTKEASIITDEEEFNKKAYVCISSYSEGYYIAFGYPNGLVQLLDTSGIYVFARLWMDSMPVSDLHGLWCFEKNVIVQDDSVKIYSASLHHRYLFNTVD